ncbi:hypothetical protein DSM03_11716 [Leeuwenhoekiella aestuarii]|uniref:hypothetical protein n=1 Tax=Leeuwenhoekiella aestuarii TaxID=2249426 RepID=UPI000FFE73BB|nr:hypothetical protein [Leeuwenhoekiella aestuarii]RXG11379.1 hypothetical protein DSM03_11716 [Leeuwenhoekiella aestuarii]
MKKETLILILAVISLSMSAQDYVPKTGGTFEGAITVNGNLRAGTGDWGALILNGKDDNDWLFNAHNSNNSFHLRTMDAQGGWSNYILSISRSSGNVGIGTQNPGSWKLAINGKIRAKEIKVETNWADFVFEDHYRLPTLKEVEQYIEHNGHLKDIPSAVDVKENGIFLGEMDAKLLQKIEELTLYIIEQNKRIDKLQKQVDNLDGLKSN